MPRFAASFLVVVAMAMPAVADPVCGHRADLIEQLSMRYSEAPAAVGLSSNGSVVEVLTAVTGTTWSIVVTTPNGVSCLVAAGENWETLQPVSVDHGI